MLRKLTALFSALIITLTAAAQDIDHKSWMKPMDDNMFLWRLSIPATHDAATSSQSGSAKTQTYTIAQQLEKGVRMFDLRPRWDGSNMYIYHGISKTNVKFNDALQTLCTFLDTNPSEFLFIIMRHEEEGASDAQKKSWPTEIYNCLNAKRRYFVDYSPTLTVKEMRGKILLMSRNHYDNGPIGAYLEGGGDNSVYDRRIEGPTGASMRITTQDIYNAAGSGKLAEKTNEIKNLLERSTASNENDYRLYFNHTSGYSQTFFGISTSAGIQECAKTCSQAVIDHMNGKTGPMGFIIMDFAGDDKYNGQRLIDLIINNNYRLIQQEQLDGKINKTEGLYSAPMGADKECRVKYFRKEGTLTNSSAPNTRWRYIDYDDSTWETLELPMGSKSFNAPYRYTWEGEKNTYWIRREVEMPEDEIAVASNKYTLRVYHDDNYDIYVNGTKVQEKTGWTNPGTPETIDITKRMKPGKNIIAVHIQQTSGGAYFDCGIIEQKAYCPVALEKETWATFVAPTGYNVDFKNTEVSAYKVVSFVNDETTPYVRIEPVSVVPSNNAVLISTTRTTGLFPIPITEATAKLDGNLLQASEHITGVSKPNTYYTVTCKDGESGFFPVSPGTTIPSHEAYLHINAADDNPVFILPATESDVTDIKISCMKPLPSVIYNLSGQRLHSTQKGINIIGFKKVVF